MTTNFVMFLNTAKNLQILHLRHHSEYESGRELAICLKEVTLPRLNSFRFEGVAIGAEEERPLLAFLDPFSGTL